MEKMLLMNDFKKVFKKELSNYEIDGIIKHITDYYKEHKEDFIIVAGSYNRNESLEDVLGLPYISSSSYAMIDATCNVDCRNSDGLRIDHFALTENNILIGVHQDDNENEFYYRVD